MNGKMDSEFKSLALVLKKLTFSCRGGGNLSDNKAWALEKVADLFTKKLSVDPSLLKKVDFESILKSLVDDEGNILQVPEFVMIELSKMITAVCLTHHGNKQADLELMFRLLQSAVSCGALDKGQRISVMFECFSRLLNNGIALEKMSSQSFFVDVALLFAVAGSQNYTRKAASTYFVELVMHSFNEARTDMENRSLTEEMRISLQETLSRVLNSFSENVLQFSNEKSHTSKYLDIAANYCRLLAECSKLSDKSLFRRIRVSGVWMNLLQVLRDSEYAEFGDVLALSIPELAVLSCNKSEDEFPMTLSSFLLESNSLICLNDLMVMACELIILCPNTWPSSTAKKLLDLAILPLLVILGIERVHQSSSLAPLVNKIRKRLMVESDGFSSSIRVAVKNAFCLVENNKHTAEADVASSLEYATFKILDPPPVVIQTFLRQGMVTSRHAQACLVSGFNFAQEIHAQIPEASMKNMQTYMPAVLESTSITHNDLCATLKCHTEMIKLLDESSLPASAECVQSILKALELHLANRSPLVREAAVNGISELFHLDISCVQDAVIQSEILPSVWGCVRDKDQGVVTQVFDFLLLSADGHSNKMLKDVLIGMKTTEENLKSELQKCLLSSGCEEIKPIAFSLLSTMTESSEVVRYAEVCVQQSNSLATQVIFKFIDQLFKGIISNNVVSKEDQLERLSFLLLEGWLDLLLGVLNGENTTCLRFAVDILISIDEFVRREEVENILKTKAGHYEITDSLRKLKAKGIKYSKQMLKGSLTSSKTSENGDSDEHVDMTEVEMCEDNTEFRFYTQQTNPGNNLDTTLEPQPLILRDEPFPLAVLVQNSVKSCADNSLPSYSFSVSVVRDILQYLPLARLHEDAHNSTDEYERNSEAVLQDLNEMMDSELKNQVKKMEEEINQVFMLELINILAIHKDKASTVILETIKELKKKIDNLSTCKELFFRFVIAQRTTVTLGCVNAKSLNFTPDFLKDGLSHFTQQFKSQVSTKEHFPSVDGMKKLITSFLEISKEHEVHFFDEINLDFFKGQCEIAGFDLTHEKKSLSDPFSTHEDFLTEAEKVGKSRQSERMCLLIFMTQRVIATFIHKIESGHLEKSFLTSVLAYLEQWCCQDEEEDFDRDGDNDPTMTDCY